MSVVTDVPPANVRADLDSLFTQLDLQIPAKGADDLLVLTWNIRSFSSLTREWMAASDRPKRDLRGLRAIIEILSRFDVVAIQEVKGDLRALRDIIRFLGDGWAFLMTDVGVQEGGTSERLAFLFHRERVHASGLAAKLVVLRDRLERMGDKAFREQFARSPYAVSFRRGDATVILVTLHVLFGDRPDDRLREIREIADWMRDWARRSNRFHHSLLTLRDFNIDRAGDMLFDAFVSTGLVVPDELLNLSRTIFDDPSSGSRIICPFGLSSGSEPARSRVAASLKLTSSQLY